MTILWKANPIVVREGRARWRGSRAFVVALFYTALLSLVMGYSYAQSSPGTGEAGNELGRAAQRGHELFQSLAMLQTGAWLLLAPALTATCIVGEREGGLLHGLLLSRLTPTQIIAGKLLSALSFIALLIVVALPILAMCFLMGGVSQSEFLGVLLMQFVTALCGASIGIAASCTQRHSTPAITMAFAIMMLWIVSSGAAFIAVFSNPIATLMPLNIVKLFLFYGWTNPFLGTFDLVSPANWMMRGAPGTIMPLIQDTSGWMICIAFQIVLSALRLWQSVRALSRPFDTLAEPLGVPKTSKFELRANKANQNSQLETPEIRSDKPASDWWHLPGTRRLVWGSAAMQRELRSRWRVRRPARAVMWSMLIPIVYAIWLYGCLCWLLLNDWALGTDVFEQSIFLWLLVGVFACALMGAGSITRERESGTWQSLRLTLLSSNEILRAKTLAPLAALAFYSAPLLPIWVLIGARNRFAHGEYSYNQVPSAVILSAVVLGLSISWFCLCWSVWCSSHSKTTSTALGWSLGGLFTLWIVLPILVGLMVPYPYRSGFENAMEFWHPVLAMGELSGARYDSDVNNFWGEIANGLVSAACFIAAGVALRAAAWQHLEAHDNT